MSKSTSKLNDFHQAKVGAKARWFAEVKYHWCN